jgi:hypothetical protein
MHGATTKILLYVQKRRSDIFKMGSACSSVQLASLYHVTRCYIKEEGIAQEVRAKIRNTYVENVTQGAQIASPRPSMGVWNDQRENGEIKKRGNLKEFVDIVVWAGHALVSGTATPNVRGSCFILQAGCHLLNDSAGCQNRHSALKHTVQGQAKVR